MHPIDCWPDTVVKIAQSAKCVRRSPDRQTKEPHRSENANNKGVGMQLRCCIAPGHFVPSEALILPVRKVGLPSSLVSADDTMVLLIGIEPLLTLRAGDVSCAQSMGVEAMLKAICVLVL